MAEDTQELIRSAADSPSSAEPYLSRPASSATAPTSASMPARNDAKHETRLYVGNLHPTVDEYALIKTFSKFGKIKKLDYLFHKSGPQRGQPRGYAFVEYASPEQALEAVVSARDRTLRGRTISVTFASKDNVADTNSSIGPHRRERDRGAGETNAVKTTQLSLNKNAKQPQGTNAKIAAMEAKLSKLRQNKATPSTSASSSPSPSHSRTGLASLPAKPDFKSTRATSEQATMQRQSLGR
ncbi:hypothetical protein EX895_001597 [Sporisorium graminicola]|uniref:Probable RNA-binding protein 18 n=1 Tax=Sporisorium graminicola TaxID=280036 RepID=A0A4U7KXM2_9BASI|nr:hypothetical protein EX895_001597 [Sporisorium graminicola]TKY89066.1 hypothetical protein EX895_001597 [Sporisorium graminicola]